MDIGLAIGNWVRVLGLVWVVGDWLLLVHVVVVFGERCGDRDGDGGVNICCWQGVMFAMSAKYYGRWCENISRVVRDYFLQRRQQL